MIDARFLLLLAVMAGVTYLIRMLPLVLVKRKITNRFLLSFLHYVPYAVLGVMAVPAFFFATGYSIAQPGQGTEHLLSAAAGFAVTLVLGYHKKGLLTVALGASLGVFLVEAFCAWVLPLLPCM